MNSVENVTDERVDYLVSEAYSLSQQSDYDIQNYADKTMSNPDARKVLLSEATSLLLAGEADRESPFGITLPASNSVLGNESFIALSFQQEKLVMGDFFNKLKAFFTGLRKKVRKIFCQVVSDLQNDGNLDLKAIIKDVLIVLIPALAASAGLMPIALSILVALAALFIKYGISKVCPV